MEEEPVREDLCFKISQRSEGKHRCGARARALELAERTESAGTAEGGFVDFVHLVDSG